MTTDSYKKGDVGDYDAIVADVLQVSPRALYHAVNAFGTTARYGQVLHWHMLDDKEHTSATSIPWYAVQTE